MVHKVVRTVAMTSGEAPLPKPAPKLSNFSILLKALPAVNGTFLLGAIMVPGTPPNN